MRFPRSLNSGLFLSLLACIAVLSGCNRSESPGPTSTDGSQTGTPRPPKAGYTLGMSQCNLGEPWRVEMNARIKAAADKHPNLKVVFKDAQNDALKQRAHVEEFVSAGVDLIIISPKEAQP
jgi:ribose transport system substrate-binding protein